MSMNVQGDAYNDMSKDALGCRRMQEACYGNEEEGYQEHGGKLLQCMR
jgi:hypothetical protein